MMVMVMVATLVSSSAILLAYVLVQLRSVNNWENG